MFVHADSAKVKDYLAGIEQRAFSTENYLTSAGNEVSGFSADLLWLKTNLYNNADALDEFEANMYTLADAYTENNNSIRAKILLLYVGLYADLDKARFIKWSAVMLKREYPDSLKRFIVRELAIKRRDPNLVQADRIIAHTDANQKSTYSREELEMFFAEILNSRTAQVNEVNNEILKQLMGYEVILPGDEKLTYKPISPKLAVEFIKQLQNNPQTNILDMIPYYKYLYEQENQPERYIALLESVVASELPIIFRQRYAGDLLKMGVLTVVEIEKLLSENTEAKFTGLNPNETDMENWWKSTKIYKDKDIISLCKLIMHMHRQNKLNNHVLKDFILLVFEANRSNLTE
jgi:hypothetical protein